MKFDFLPESDQAYYIHKASTLVEALPYIREHAGQTIVIKYGGHAMSTPKLADSFSRDIGLMKEIGIFPVVVHGGGPQIGEVLKQKNIKSEFINGLRVTSKDTMNVVEEVLTNDINNKIVSAINKTGGKSIGLNGSQNGLIEATKLEIQVKEPNSNIEKYIDIGFVGKPNNINKNTINDKLKEGFIPVIAPLGMDKEKNIYNINADTAAGFIASELKANKLLLLTDVPGILDEKKQLISSLSLEEANKILDEDFVSGGMKPKILTCIEAMNKGVKKSTILDGRIPHSLILELFTEHGIGTQIYS
tara:strand:+ start:1616 stop:2527 length:912 start_codon:yes stop_codon:yes gene_type:complete